MRLPDRTSCNIAISYDAQRGGSSNKEPSDPTVTPSITHARTHSTERGLLATKVAESTTVRAAASAAAATATATTIAEATTAATTATAAAVTEAAATTTSATSATRRVPGVRTRQGVVQTDRATADGLAVQVLQGLAGLLGRRELDVAKAARVSTLAGIVLERTQGLIPPQKDRMTHASVGRRI